MNHNHHVWTTLAFNEEKTLTIKSIDEIDGSKLKLVIYNILHFHIEFLCGGMDDSGRRGELDLRVTYLYYMWS